MSFSINTNIASLDAQNYLQQSVQFQAQTINEVTSGLRIVNSGDDAAGLAIANGLAADQAVLTQGIQNANDGLATLQTIDGGMNNISQLLDRASTLATESASGTFTGDRTVLNSEFQSVLTEVNRQAQSIGLNSRRPVRAGSERFHRRRSRQRQHVGDPERFGLDRPDQRDRGHTEPRSQRLFR